MAERARLRGLLLVGGQSTRMGEPKQLLRLDGLTFAERVARSLAAVTDDLLLAGAGPLPAALDAHRRLTDVPGVPGPLAGLLAALRHDPGAAWLVAACDLPRCSPEALRWLLAHRAAAAPAVIPSRGGRPEPLLALYEPAILPHAEALALEARPGPRALAAVPGVLTPEVPPALAAAFTNVNTPGELAALASAVANPAPPE
ncbi:MAG: molybdenum cofactor guanylyltransferase [Deltaproteobacteria bacterium]|nr:molybdenum cofactor guanylyltransferase [Deltaproteobacteria bacterium]MCB9785541.1 molybdenum cofactor guanylyltransferase [Deltaproteobacteria bacterium]